MRTQMHESQTARRIVRRAASSLVAAVALMAIIVGVPIALLRLAPPLVLTAPGYLVAHPGALAKAIEHPPSIRVLTESATSIAWAAWVWFAMCILVELGSRTRGRAPRPLPGSAPLQALVAMLVGTMLTVIPVARTTPLVRFMPTVAEAPGMAPAEMDEGAASEIELVSDVSPLPAQADAPRSYTVLRGDTLWSIAESQLGSPLRWREIAAINYLRPQPDGRTLDGDHWIYPGWVLVLPDSAPNGQASWPSARVSPESGGPEASRPTALDRQFVAESRPVGHHRPTVPGAPIAPVAYGVLGAGVIGLLEGLRRAQRRHRPTGLRIALPDGDLAALELRLRAGADTEGAAWIDLGMRALLVSSRLIGVDPPLVQSVRLTPATLEIAVLAPHGNPPDPFVRGARSGVWVLPRTDQVANRLRHEVALAGVDSPLPALVTLGRDDRGLVMLDIEQAGSLAVTGTSAGAILNGIVLELATARWSDQVDLVLVGLDVQLKGMERVRFTPALSAVLPEVRKKVQERRTLMDAFGQPSNWASRWAGGGDAWDLVVFVVAPWATEADPVGSRELMELCGDGSSGVVVVSGGHQAVARWRVVSDGDQISIEPPLHDGSVLFPNVVDDSTTNGVGSLIEVAMQLDGVSDADPPYDGLSLPFPSALEPAQRDASESRRKPLMDVESAERRAHGDRRATVSRGDDSWNPEVEIRILGPADVRGAARPFDRARAWTLELVAYLAMHPGGVTTDQWSTALWPERMMAPSSLHSTASAARRTLGVASTGVDHLPRSHGRLALGETVKTDWDHFVGLASAEDPESWRAALELVRGRPFDGLRSPDWALLEGIEASIEAGVVDLACRLAEASLTQRDPSVAERAARQALRVSPYDERLFRILMRAADMAGNPAGVESVMAELVHLVAGEVEPFDVVHPETLELYRTLSRRSGAAPRSVGAHRPRGMRMHSRLG